MMLYQSTVKATITFLRLLKVEVNAATVNETLQSHPDWPSLLCISDSFRKWNIPTGAGKIDPYLIDQLPCPFIANTNHENGSLVIVTKVSENVIETYQNNYYKPIEEKRSEFLTQWNGIYLISEPNANSGEPDYKRKKRRRVFKLSLFFLLVLILLFFQLNKFSEIFDTSFHPVSLIGFFFQYIIMLVGVAVTTLLMWHEVDKNNPILQKVCTGIIKGSCSAVLTGKSSKVFSWLSWSEIGFSYFSGGLLTLFFLENTISNSIAIVSWLNILALPYIIFSVYHQWKVAKNWCILCLTVQLLLLLGGVNIWINSLLIPITISVTLIFKTILLYVLPLLTWFILKPYVLSLQELKNIKRQHLRIKFIVDVFESLLKKGKTITSQTRRLGIDLGNPTATNTLIKVCNPYCGPCARVHAQVETLLKNNYNLQVKIIFATPNEPKHPSFKPVSHLLAFAQQNNINSSAIAKALDDWYSADKKDYTLFAKKYEIGDELLRQGNKIEAMDNWCKEMNIKHTPTFFINGHELPDAYDVEDIQYFLLE